MPGLQGTRKGDQASRTRPAVAANQWKDPGMIGLLCFLLVVYVCSACTMMVVLTVAFRADVRDAPLTSALFILFASVNWPFYLYGIVEAKLK